MDTTLCAGGCGTPTRMKNGFAFGHKHGCPSTDTPPPQPDDQTETDAPEAIDCQLTEAQLNRIWTTLSLHDKAVAILTVLNEPQAE